MRKMIREAMLMFGGIVIMLLSFTLELTTFWTIFGFIIGSLTALTSMFSLVKELKAREDRASKD